jgi:hypothetical protein
MPPIDGEFRLSCNERSHPSVKPVGMRGNPTPHTGSDCFVAAASRNNGMGRHTLDMSARDSGAHFRMPMSRPAVTMEDIPSRARAAKM